MVKGSAERLAAEGVTHRKSYALNTLATVVVTISISAIIGSITTALTFAEDDPVLETFINGLCYPMLKIFFRSMLFRFINLRMNFGGTPKSLEEIVRRHHVLIFTLEFFFGMPGVCLLCMSSTWASYTVASLTGCCLEVLGSCIYVCIQSNGGILTVLSRVTTHGSAKVAVEPACTAAAPAAAPAAHDAGSSRSDMTQAEVECVDMTQAVPDAEEAVLGRTEEAEDELKRQLLQCEVLEQDKVQLIMAALGPLTIGLAQLSAVSWAARTHDTRNTLLAPDWAWFACLTALNVLFQFGTDWVKRRLVVRWLPDVIGAKAVTFQGFYEFAVASTVATASVGVCTLGVQLFTILS
jgi:hypothetical protein